MKTALTCLNFYITAVNSMNDKIGRAVSWLTLILVLLTFSVVILRYCFNIGWIAMQEAMIYLHVLIFMLGAAYTLQKDKHVRVDIFYQYSSARVRAWIDFFGCVSLLLPVCVFIFWYSWDYVLDSWQIREGSRHAGGLPGLFLLKSVIPVMALLLILQGTAMAGSKLLEALQADYGAQD